MSASAAAIGKGWKTRFTQRLPCCLPIMGAPMAGVSGGSLAAATCRAGALGFIAAGYGSPKDRDHLEQEIRIFQQEAPAGSPLCLGFITFAALHDMNGWKYYQSILESHKPHVVQFFAPAVAVHPETGQTNVQLAQAHKALVLAQVGNVEEGKQALQAGVDGLIAQGSEAGGHGLRRDVGRGTLALASHLVQLAAAQPQPPPIVLAAGGISNGRGVAATLALGCDGAVLGTRLWASQQALCDHASFQQALVDAMSGDAVVRTRVFDQMQNMTRPVPWPEPYDSVGALRNVTTEAWDGRATALQQQLDQEQQQSSSLNILADYQRACREGEVSKAQVLAGEGVGEIDAIEPVEDILSRIDQEARDVIQNLSTLL